jgi:hypothetical protein
LAQVSSDDGMGLAHSQILPTTSSWPRIVSEEFRR